MNLWFYYFKRFINSDCIYEDILCGNNSDKCFTYSYINNKCEKLKEKYNSEKNKFYYLFSKSGFDKKITSLNEKNVKLIDLKKIENIK